MRHLIIMVLAILLLAGNTFAQRISWGNTDSSHLHLAQLSLGLHFGIETKLGFAHKLPCQRPTWVGARFSFLAGSPLFDDRHLQIGLQRAWALHGPWTVAGKLMLGHRMHKNGFANISSLSSEFGMDIGYFKQGWYLALALDWEEFLASHLKHNDEARKIYPEIRDGWLPALSSGNIRIGLATGLSVKRLDGFLAVGRMLDHRFQNSFTMPFYAELGLGWRF